jgi:hypothetical protein
MSTVDMTIETSKPTYLSRTAHAKYLMAIKGLEIRLAANMATDPHGWQYNGPSG